MTTVEKLDNLYSILDDLDALAFLLIKFIKEERGELYLKEKK